MKLQEHQESSLRLMVSQWCSWDLNADSLVLNPSPFLGDFLALRQSQGLVTNEE